MPIYDYDCHCGLSFSAQRAIAERDRLAACPDCGGDGRRRVAAPRLAALSRTNRIAHERNERSAHEPRMHRVEADAPAGGAHPHQAHRHAHGHGHSHGRPWMLGH